MTSNNPDAEFSSPACSMHEADGVYMGYAPREELVAFLNTLLEAERAGSRVTLETARAADEGPIATLMAEIQIDEAHWAGMLAGHIKALDASPSNETGAFYQKAMAIEEIEVRIALLNRGQGWVARKLREMLPRVRDERMHTDLTAMLRGHETNIERVNDAISVPNSLGVARAQ